MSKWTEWRDETKASIAAWWHNSPRAQAFIYGYLAGLASFGAVLMVFA